MYRHVDGMLTADSARFVHNYSVLVFTNSCPLSRDSCRHCLYRNVVLFLLHFTLCHPSAARSRPPPLPDTSTDLLCLARSSTFILMAAQSECDTGNSRDTGGGNACSSTPSPLTAVCVGSVRPLCLQQCLLSSTFSGVATSMKMQMLTIYCLQFDRSFIPSSSSSWWLPRPVAKLHFNQL